MEKQNMSRGGNQTRVLLWLMLMFVHTWTSESSTTTAITSAAQSKIGCFPIYSDHDNRRGSSQTSLSSTSKHLKMLEISLGSSSSAKNDSSCSVDLIEDDHNLSAAGYNVERRMINVSIDASSVGDPKVVLQWLSKATHEHLYYFNGNNHSRCYTNGSRGYHCECEQGYAGNPYSPQGCLEQVDGILLANLPLMVVDIDECKETETFPCYGICENTPGSYKCSCPPGMLGDAKVYCKRQQNIATTLKKPNGDPERNVVRQFVSLVETDALFQNLNILPVDEGEKEQIKIVAKLAIKCLNSNRSERPKMKDVVEELDKQMRTLNGNSESGSNISQEATVNSPDIQPSSSAAKPDIEPSSAAGNHHLGKGNVTIDIGQLQNNNFMTAFGVEPRSVSTVF
ncbi:hypothetical protein FEM48_Zijuj11G0073500 [Ziziphus jujuba var. spinosa]|uniref:EGF-like domain-containing protein n=1 Tax=Ziziphus jujuba var. spinosa TaxID=714518 RepID=A0A978UHL4_ZIZJJ|nr:hypothetical protein FEM48_Zijuj11G0073500 [Ziziphus jujuba var. spinosa]